jgi:hypothetical protein
VCWPTVCSEMPLNSIDSVCLRESACRAALNQTETRLAGAAAARGMPDPRQGHHMLLGPTLEMRQCCPFQYQTASKACSRARLFVHVSTRLRM